MVVRPCNIDNGPFSLMDKMLAALMFGTYCFVIADNLEVIAMSN